MQFLFFFSLFFFSVSANADSKEFASLDHFLLQISQKKEGIWFHRSGDLNNDGIEDWAGLLSRDREGEAPLIRFVVLTQLSNGHYAESVSTGEVEDYYRYSPSSSFDFEIRASNLFFTTSAHTCCEYSSIVYQFKLYKGNWRLIGRRVSTGNTPDDPKDSYNKVDNENMLTGQTITIVERGNKKTERRHIKKRRVFLLKDFDFSGAYAAP